MWFRVTKTRALPIGIDLGTAGVKVAQLRRVGGELELAATALAKAPAQYRDDFDADLSSLAYRLRRLLDGRNFIGRKCVLALPAETTFIYHAKTAKLPTERLERFLRKEMQDRAPFDPLEAVVRHIVVGEIYNDGRAGQEVIVIAASRQTVEAYLELARQSGLDVVALKVAPCAMVDCFAQLYHPARDDDRLTLYLNLGHMNTQVVIAQGARLAFARNLTLGSRHVDEAAAARLGIRPDELSSARRELAEDSEPSGRVDRIHGAVCEAMQDMVGEIANCLRYYDSAFPARPVERVLFLGGQARDRRFCEEIARRIDLPAHIGDPLARVGRADGVKWNTGMDRRQAQPAWAVAVGLSIGAEMPNAA